VLDLFLLFVWQGASSTKQMVAFGFEMKGIFSPSPDRLSAWHPPPAFAGAAARQGRMGTSSPGLHRERQPEDILGFARQSKNYYQSVRSDRLPINPFVQTNSGSFGVLASFSLSHPDVSGQVSSFTQASPKLLAATRLHFSSSARHH
jgi:hypothetical protein